MNPYIRERIQRKLDTLSDERLYQVLDYVEFLETKYAERAASPVSFFQKFTESVEDKMRVGGLSVSAISETVGFLNKAANALNGVAQSTMSVASDVAGAAVRTIDQIATPAAPPVNAQGAGNASQIASPNGSQPGTNLPAGQPSSPMPPDSTGK